MTRWSLTAWEIGGRPLFSCISDTDSTYNFLVALAFSQMFNLLCERADNVHGGRLPHHVRVLWDEAANTGQVPDLEKLVAVIRSREISPGACCISRWPSARPSMTRHAETILGNMDSVMFLGGREAQHHQGNLGELAGQGHHLHADGGPLPWAVRELQPEHPAAGPGADDPQPSLPPCPETSASCSSGACRRSTPPSTI